MSLWLVRFFDKIFGSRNLLKSNKSILTVNIAQQLKDVVPSELHGDVKSRVALWTKRWKSKRLAAGNEMLSQRSKHVRIASSVGRVT